MKKILNILLVSIVLLSGCNGKETNVEQIKLYEGFKESIMNNGGLPSTNIPFDYDVEIKEKANVYYYTVIVSNPRVYMGNVQMLVLNPDDLTTDYVSSSKGVFDEHELSMIPNQENMEKGYMKDIKLSGVSEKKNFQLYCMISYKDHDQQNQYQTYFSFDIVEGHNTKAGIKDE